jgi:hypothetical protein
MPMGFYVLLGVGLLWVGLLGFLGQRRVRAAEAALHDLSHLRAVEAFLAELLDRADELRLPGDLEHDVAEIRSLVVDVLDNGVPLAAAEAQDLSDFLHDLTLALPYLPDDDPRPVLAQNDVVGQPARPQDADRFAEYVGLSLSASSLAARMDEVIHDSHYALALASHEPSFSPGAPVLPLDAGGPAHMGV